VQFFSGKQPIRVLVVFHTLNLKDCRMFKLSEVFDTKSVAENIFALLLGQERMRPRDWVPREEHKKFLLDKIQRFVDANYPVDCFVMSGGAKVFGMAAHWGPDLGDYSWIKGLTEMAECVEKVHSRGIRINVYLEDYGRRYFSQQSPEETEARIYAYYEGLTSLASSLGAKVNLRLESEIFGAIKVPAHLQDRFGVKGTCNFDCFATVANVLSDMFERYWTDTKACCPERDTDVNESLESWKALAEVGFKGSIPKIQREYYLKRAQCCSSCELVDDSAQRRVTSYLGAAFARKLLGLVTAEFFDSDGEIHPIQLSYVPHAPGTPEHLSWNRIEKLAYMRSKKSSRTVAPWGGYGCLEGERITIVSPSSLATKSLIMQMKDFDHIRLPTYVTI